MSNILMSPKNILAVIIILIVFIFPALFAIIGDYFWFTSISLESVFLKILFTSIGLGLATGLVFLAFSFLNIKMATRSSGKKLKTPKVLFLLAALLSLVIGVVFSGGWDVLLQYLNASSFQAVDPIFSLNIGFFVFEYPFFLYILSYAASLVMVTIFLTLGTYLFHHTTPPSKEEFAEEINLPSYIEWKSFKKQALPHMSFLLGILFFLIAFGFLLGQWALLFSPTGTVFGAGYTDVNFTLPLFTILMFVSGVVGLLLMANMKINRWRLPMETILAFIIILILGFAVTGVVQALVVAPDEFNLEQPFIELNIEHTSQAYNLQNIQESTFPVSYNLTQEDLMSNEETINNIRLWDFRPLIQTYNQLQLFRTYYAFNDVDIDRYSIDGETKQVMVSAREMDLDSLPSQAQTWVNRHLVYTHGYGLVMNPVDKVTSEGLPDFYIRDIPPESPVATDRNEIYFGESDLEYVVVKTTTEEFDYPSGDENTYTTYEGTDGISLDLFSRLIFALKFSSPELLFSNSIQPESKLLIHRHILDRVNSIAPFLTYDSDPYLVLSEGKMFWVIDAYTTSSFYPYSQPFEVGFLSDINYVRNSVKVVVDAYNGDVKFYVIEPEDPVIQTYQKIFPSLFIPFEQMSGDLQEHIRYPEGLFRIQAEIYSTYHMKDPRVFYNREDVWVEPEEVYRGHRQELIPYYVIMKLPGEEKEEFILMMPFVPRGKDNLIGWMAARSDYPHYGEMVVYRFSKQELIYGPLQIEARIDQDTDISALFTLWSQSGSSVIRGNTLVIPIEDSILYIEPVFLEATEKGTLPQLKRVIVAYGNRLTMQSTLEEALEVIFTGYSQDTGDGDIVIPAGTPEDVLAQIADLYNQAQSALTQGDLATYASFMNQIGQLLEGY